jgi:hypothetical protein
VNAIAVLAFITGLPAAIAGVLYKCGQKERTGTVPIPGRVSGKLAVIDF